jgi:Na+/H+ antiporter NhaC
MMVTLILLKFDFGPMKKYEDGTVQNNDPLFGMKNLATQANEGVNEKGIVLDLVFPVILLIISCVVGMIYTGGFFQGETLIDAFSNADASVGLMLGSAFTLIITIVYYLFRKVLSFKDMMGCIPEGFKSMVSAILILTLAWTLKAMTDSLGAKEFIAGVVETSAGGFQSLLPAIIFAIAVGMSFATGTSWGTFGILIPITISVFPVDSAIGVICVSACMAGAVCGDHCSPISDTTIKSSAGADCDHVVHVSTQLPYALTCAAVSFVTYIIAGFVRSAAIVLPIGIILMVAAIFGMKKRLSK